MDKIITDEFIRYKNGFIEGKNKIVEFTTLGIPMDEEDEYEFFDDWILYGYKDGVTYYSNLASNNMDLFDVDIDKVISDSFSKKVMEVNQNEGKEIPSGKFKM